MKGPNVATIEVLTTGPVHLGDSVQFKVTPPDAGVITCYGTEPGSDAVVWSVALVRGVTGCVIGPSSLYDGGPLHVSVTLSELVHHKVKVIAETAFEVEG